MVDCILEEWLADHPNTPYPVAPQVRDGHRRDDFSRAFFPLYTNGELFVPARAFGYTCELADIPDGATRSMASPLLLLATILAAISAMATLSK